MLLQIQGYCSNLIIMFQIHYGFCYDDTAMHAYTKFQTFQHENKVYYYSSLP